ncbi:MAG: hypothetical protein ISR64_09970 [Deltaproteobacteria bacterium]|nr:hypothetical protein [Deltaproteobacteria bacterium]
MKGIPIRLGITLTLYALLLALAWAGCRQDAAQESQPAPEPERPAIYCHLDRHCSPGSTCAKGRCGTGPSRNRPAKPRIRVVDEFERAQKQIQDNRDRAIERNSPHLQ